MNLDNLKISTRLIILISVLSVFLMAIGGIGFFGIGASNDALRSVYADRTVPAGQLGDIGARQISNELLLTEALLNPAPDVVASKIALVEANIAAITKSWDAYMLTTLTKEEAALAKVFTEERKKFAEEGLKPALAALRANDMKEAQRLLSEKVGPLYHAAKKSSDALVQLQLDEAEKAFHAAEARYATIRMVSISAIAGGMLFAGLFGWVMVRSIGRQLGAEPGEAASVAQSVGSGDLSIRIDLKSGDTSSLMAQLKLMQENLIGIVGNVRQGTDTIATASSQIAAG
ncbi:Tar ligand binding domain-containing protein, partial [Polaromonas sp.]|uniref:Tar ligand binding domain-containing protein n=1 Tax=Polaromonas sp. TaxID=1869339 RepID=UPI003265BC49